MVKRFSRPAFGTRVMQPLPQQDCITLLATHPLSRQYVVPTIKNKTELATYIIANQKKKFGTTILDTLSYPILLRNISLLLAQYSMDMVVRAVDYAQLIATYPYSTKFIGELIHGFIYDKQSSQEK